MEYLTSSKRWSRNERDIEPLKSSIGEISSKISSRPERSGTSLRPAALASATRACQRSLPSSQSKLSVCRARRSGTSRGSRIFANDRRPEAVRAVDTVWVALREAAKDGPSTGLLFSGDTRPSTRLPRSDVSSEAAAPVRRARQRAAHTEQSLRRIEDTRQRKATAYPKKGMKVQP